MQSKLKKAAAITAGGAGAAFVAWKVWRRIDARRNARAMDGHARILIVGAGFAGMTVAEELSKLLPASSACRITLLDRNNFLLFTPMLTEVAGGELDPADIVAPARKLSPRVHFEQGTIREIDLPNKTVHLEDGRVLEAEHLVLALGSAADYHDIPGLQEHAISVTSIRDALAIRNRVLGNLEHASTEPDPARRREYLTFVVGGGGYTGVETMAAINDLARGTAKEYPNIAPEEITTVIVEPGDRLMHELSPDLAAFGQNKLQEHGVEVLLKSSITSAGEDYIELEHSKRIPTRLLVWAGGVTPNPLTAHLPCEHDKHGSIIVEPTLAVSGHPGVWAIGDCAEVPHAGSDTPYAPTAQNATREGELVARNIIAALRGDPLQPFDYEPIGELALVGRHSGVARLYGHQFSGFLAWAMWRAVYLAKMPGMAQRSRIALDWLLDFVFGRNIAEIPVDRAAH